MNFGAWDTAIHKDSEQQKRIATAKKADTTPISVDRENKTAIFKGSGKSPYITSLDSCSCRDFFVRKLPCKHMYRLVFELDGVKVQQGMNKNEYAIFALPVESQKMLYDMCVSNMNFDENTFIYERDEFSKSLFCNGFCIENVLTLEALKALPVSTIKRILSMSVPDMEGLPPKTAQRKSITLWLETNYALISPSIESKVIVLEFTEQLRALTKQFYKRFRQKFIREEEPTQYFNSEMELTLDYNDTRTVLKEYFTQE